MAKIAVTCVGKTLEDQVDPRFGRAANFLIVDTETMDYTLMDNTKVKTMGQGAGIQSSAAMAEAGVGAVLTGFVGPNAFKGLEAAGIEVAQGLEGLTARQAVEKYLAGQAEIASAPSKEGHWT